MIPFLSSLRVSFCYRFKGHFLILVDSKIGKISAPLI